LYDESQGIALSEVQKREAEYRAAEGGLIAARSAVTAAENALHVLGMDQEAIERLAQTTEIDPNYVILAPFGGRVIEREATLGEAVGPDRDALLVLADLSTLWVIADLPEARIGEIGTGSKARVFVPAFRGRDFEGAVTYLGTQLNAATRTIPVRIEVQDAESMLRPGMFAQAEIEAGEATGEPVPAIPEVAVQNVEGDTCVFVPVKGEANTFAKRVVRIGPPIGRMVPVLDGLREGEPYVARGSFILKADLGKAGAAHEH
jgi:cobalt-zinc-cadmium efflux system membrane fusion protein